MLTQQDTIKLPTQYRESMAIFQRTLAAVGWLVDETGDNVVRGTERLRILSLVWPVQIEFVLSRRTEESTTFRMLGSIAGAGFFQRRHLAHQLSRIKALIEAEAEAEARGQP